MEWLFNDAEEYRSHIRRGAFFKELDSASRPGDLSWVHQLVHQSREFTQALCLRYSLCHDKAYQSIFARHAMEEVDHPDQLLAWIDEHGFLKDERAGAPPTRETSNTLSYCWRIATREPHDVQIVALNLLSEGVALDFYNAVIPVLRRLNILSGRYWNVHSDIDDQHLRLGFETFGDVAPDSPKGQIYRRVLWQSADLFTRC